MRKFIYSLLFFMLTTITFTSCIERWYMDSIIYLTIDPEWDPRLSWWDLTYHNTDSDVDWDDNNTFDAAYNYLDDDNGRFYELKFEEYLDIKATIMREDVTFTIWDLNEPIYGGDDEIYLSQSVSDLHSEHQYIWNPGAGSFEDLGRYKEEEQEDPDPVSSSNPLLGTWDRVDGCVNINGVVDYLYFSSNGTGRYFVSDCNSACSGYGFAAYFNYTYTSSSVSVTYKSVDGYCGIDNILPTNTTSDYTISGTTLTLEGIDFKK